MKKTEIGLGLKGENNLKEKGRRTDTGYEEKMGTKSWK